MLDNALNRERPRQQLRCRVTISRLQRFADTAGGNDVRAIRHGRNRFCDESVFPAQLCKDMHIAAASLAERKILSGHHTAHASKPLGDELFGCQSRQRSVERENDHCIGARF